MQHRLALFLTAGVVAVAASVSACSSSSSSGPTGTPSTGSAGNGAAVDITVRNYAFEPASVETGAGAQVLWTVTEGTHEIVATDGAQFDSGALESGNTFTWAPDFAGSRTVSYKCKIHPTQMTGTIQVTG